MALPATRLNEVKKIISKRVDLNHFNVFIFGSWADGTNRRFSDIDIGIEGKNKFPEGVIWKLKDDFEESDFPYTVDIVDFKTADKKFVSVAKKHIINL